MFVGVLELGDESRFVNRDGGHICQGIARFNVILGELAIDHRCWTSSGSIGRETKRILEKKGIFEAVWKAFKAGEAVPEIDFKANLVLFARNTQFFNRIRIGKVNVTNGVVELLAAETMSAIPIQNKVAMSMVVVPRKGIKSIRTADGLVRYASAEDVAQQPFQ